MSLKENAVQFTAKEIIRILFENHVGLSEETTQNLKKLFVELRPTDRIRLKMIIQDAIRENCF